MHRVGVLHLPPGPIRVSNCTHQQACGGKSLLAINDGLSTYLCRLLGEDDRAEKVRLVATKPALKVFPKLGHLSSRLSNVVIEVLRVLAVPGVRPLIHRDFQKLLAEQASDTNGLIAQELHV